MTHKFVALLAVFLLVAFVGTALAADDAKPSKAEKKRDDVDGMTQQTLDKLFDESPDAKKLYDKAYGYAVFSSVKVALGVSGGGGSGVAVERGSGERTYMRMGTAGVGLGLGGKRYQIVFLFQDQKTFDNFVEKGWQADTSASAAAGTSGVGVASTFTNGLAIYQFTEKGLMAQAEVAGTKYWKSDKLN